MAFDGIPRPSQLTPADPLNPYLASNAARAEQAGKPLIKAPGHDEKVKAVHKEQRENHEGENEEREPEFLSEEEEEQLRKFAKVRGLLNFSLEKGVRYQFQINGETGQVDLVSETGQVVLSLSPVELMQLSEKIQRYAGMLTDRRG